MQRINLLEMQVGVANVPDSTSESLSSFFDSSESSFFGLDSVVPSMYIKESEPVVTKTLGDVL